MVGLEGPRRRAAGNLLHHRRFHFKIAALVKEPAQRLERLGALDEDFARFEVGEQVHIALAVAQLHVGQAVKLLRQRQHGLGQEGQPLHVDGQLAGPGAEQVARHADVVAQVEQLVERKALLAHRVQADVDLQPLAVLLQRGKAGLALGADGHDAPGDGHRDAVGLQLLGLRLAPLGAHRGNGVRGRELVGIGRLAQLLDLFQLCLAQIEEIALKLRIEHGVSFHSNGHLPKREVYPLRGLPCMLDRASMPFNRPIPDAKPRSKASSGVSALVEAEKLMQIALLLPSAAFIGWLLGAWVDSHLHQSWIGIAGIVFGGDLRAGLRGPDGDCRCRRIRQDREQRTRAKREARTDQP